MTCEQAYMERLVAKQARARVIDECCSIVTAIINNARENGDSDLRSVRERVCMELDVYKARAEDK